MSNCRNPDLAALRQKAGLTQERLAEILGVRQATISDWERGVQMPHMPLDKVLLLCK
ncbi:MAG: helix-turn-helix domain-containing protein, partial [Thermosynechococcus sp.]|uniref:helix-turn-helix domain-containing protein n=1 Tax=Thermosynechococcus sp. TaxID=2814275 RepID=UPI00391CB053